MTPKTKQILPQANSPTKTQPLQPQRKTVPIPKKNNARARARASCGAARLLQDLVELREVLALGAQGEARAKAKNKNSV